MYDRIPAAGKANRVKITMDDGTAIEGVLSYADDATQEGSAYSRANVLPDDVCDQLAIDPETSEPKDAFLALNTRIFYQNAYSKYEYCGKMLDPRGDSATSFLLGELNNYVIGYVSGSDSNMPSFYYDEMLTYHNDLNIPTSSSNSRKARANLNEYLILMGDTSSGSGKLFALTDTLTLITLSDAPLPQGFSQSWYSAGYNSNYALFSYEVDTYQTGLLSVNEALVSSYLSDYPETRVYMVSGGTNGDEYAMFAGGSSPGGNGERYVCAYNSALTLSVPTSLSQNTVYQASAYVNGYCLFAAGRNRTATGSATKSYKDVIAYSETLTRSLLADTNGGGLLDGDVNKNAGTSPPGFAIFADNSGNGINAYNSTLTKSSIEGVYNSSAPISHIGPFIISMDSAANGEVAIQSYKDMYILTITVPAGWSIEINGDSIRYDEETEVTLADENPVNCILYLAPVTYTGQIL